MAVSYPIFPNIPKPADLKLIQEAVRKARRRKLGMWAEEDTLLLPYEYRFCVDTLLGKRRGPDKYCVDITTGLIHQPQAYYTIPPENRLFIYEKDLAQAIERLNLRWP